MAELGLGIVILLFSIGLIQHHREAWHARRPRPSGEAEESAADEQQASYERLQLIRRTIASALMAVVGVLLILDYIIEDLTSSVIMVMIIVILLMPIFGLACWDAIAGRNKYRAEANEFRTARKAMYEEAQRLMIQKHEQERLDAESNSNTTDETS